VTAPVRIEACAWGDLRFATLARLCGFADAEHALIKCSKIWSWQTEHYTPDAPTYVVDAEIIESAIGELGAERMVRARLAEATPDGFRIKGSEDRIEWLWKSRRASAAGGEATKRKHANKGRPDGLPAAMPGARPEAGPQTGLTPGPLSPDLPPDLGSRNTYTHARDRHPSAGRVVEAVWKHASNRCAELKIANIPSVAPWPLMAGGDHPGRLALLDRVCEVLVETSPEEAQRVAMNRVDVAHAKAIDERDGGRFTPLGMFSRNSFDSFAHIDPKTIGRRPAQPNRPKNGAIGSATPRTDHGTEMKQGKEVM
jgi:hypothetical protein